MDVTELDPFQPGQDIADGDVYAAHVITAYRLAWSILGSMTRDEVTDFRKTMLANDVVGMEEQAFRHFALLGPRILQQMYGAADTRGTDLRPVHHLMLAVQALADLQVALGEYKASLKTDEASRRRREDAAYLALINAVSGAHWANTLRMAWKHSNVEVPDLLEAVVPMVRSRAQSNSASQKNAAARAAALGLWDSGVFRSSKEAWRHAALELPEVKAIKSRRKLRLLDDWLRNHRKPK